MAKNLVLFTTHVINKAVISEYKKFLNIPDYDCVLAIDNEDLKLEPEYSDSSEPRKDLYLVDKVFYDTTCKCFLFDKKLHDYLGLPLCAKFSKSYPFYYLCWYNADYRFYYINHFLPDYDYYWQFDYDVYLNGKSYEVFFDKYNNRNEDLLIPRFRKVEKGSTWVG